MKLNDVSGQRFGRLLVVEKDDQARMWRCVCDCGASTLATSSALRLGKKSSCGCALVDWAKSMGANRAFVDKRAAKVTRHGHKRVGATSVEYATWLAIKRRCYSPKSKDFANWGGRGIGVCERWRNSFEAFLADMGHRPAGEFSIDRLNPDGDYEPGNCRWVLQVTQAAENKRTLIPVTIDGITFPSLRAACRAFGAPYTTVVERLRHGIAIDVALRTPVHGLPNSRTKESYTRRSARA